MTSAHNPGPWKAKQVDAYAHLVTSGHSNTVCATSGHPYAKADAARIVACVNALEGIEDPVAVLRQVRDFLRSLTCDTGARARQAAELLTVIGVDS